MASQEIFQNCYRGRQSGFRHMAYMRMAKVLLLQHLIRTLGIELEGRRVLDYGFGSGTFFRYCPPGAHLHGLELDPVCVAEVAQMLRARGHPHVELQPLEIATWESHPLLQRQYDVIVCSHVLEHLEQPENFLRRISRCLAPDGVFLGLVPINERRQDPHHVWRMTETLARGWLAQTPLELALWLEADPWIYWVQPLFAHESGLRHKLAQAVSTIIGPLATGLGFKAWHRLAPTFARLTGSKPTQAAFALRLKQGSERPSSKP